MMVYPKIASEVMPFRAIFILRSLRLSVVAVTCTTRSLRFAPLDEMLDDLNALPYVGFCEGVGLETVKGGKGTLLTLRPISGAAPSQLAGILELVPEVLRKYQVETFHLGGVWYLTNRLDTLSAQATTLLFPVVLLVVSIAVFFLCRTQALLILSCGLISAMLLVGMIGLCGVKMNMVLLALPPLTLILGMAHAIHFSIKKWQPDDTAVTLFCRVAPPCVLSGVTTAMGFGSLLFSSYQPVRELGIWGAAGTLFSLVVTFVLVPVFLKPSPFFRRLVLPATTSLFLARNRRKIGFLLLLAMIAAGIGIGRLQKGSSIPCLQRKIWRWPMRWSVFSRIVSAPQPYRM